MMIGSRVGNEGEEGAPVDPMLCRASDELLQIAREVCAQPPSQCSGYDCLSDRVWVVGGRALWGRAAGDPQVTSDGKGDSHSVPGPVSRDHGSWNKSE